jgi:hypothetical protein
MRRYLDRIHAKTGASRAVLNRKAKRHAVTLDGRKWLEMETGDAPARER